MDNKALNARDELVAAQAELRKAAFKSQKDLVGFVNAAFFQRNIMLTNANPTFNAVNYLYTPAAM